ncbi:MAG TPA: DegT/DnrJ/EryC1/StrS family aminotransferase [Bryobacteraceae bacterium]|nr:DegT/DnrJ/EryC1/StrS family aminotransferase [Bryobacteraceae bacterium]
MDHFTRRGFNKSMLAGAAAAGFGAAPAGAVADSPALLGGKPARTAPFPSWPKVESNDEKAWSDVLRGGKWCRLDGDRATQFERTWAKTLGVAHCTATASGTTALFTTLNALDIGPGDEVIVPPYTFVATVNVVLLQHALPVFVDTDIDTFQIDARKIEAAITPHTRAILPVHLGGSPADMDTILSVAARHKIPVVEDACQAHLAEWRGRKVGSLGQAGCFSFQASKNLNSGEGGAITTNDAALLERAVSFCKNGRGGGSLSGYVRNGSNHRITEFQASLLSTQLSRLAGQAAARERNAQYLTKRLQQIPGILPARMYPGVTRNAYHLYMLRYDASHFSGLPRAQFLKALRAEGVPAYDGYTPLNKEAYLENTLQSRAFRRIYSAPELKSYRERNHCPVNDRLCQEAVWFGQTMLLGGTKDMDDIADAIGKIQKHAGALIGK